MKKGPAQHPSMDDLNALLQSLAKPVSRPTRPHSKKTIKKKGSPDVQKCMPNRKHKSKGRNKVDRDLDNALLDIGGMEVDALPRPVRSSRSKKASNVLQSTNSPTRTVKRRRKKPGQAAHRQQRMAIEMAEGSRGDNQEIEGKTEGELRSSVHFKDVTVTEPEVIPEPNVVSSDGEQEARAMIAAVQKIAAERKQSQIRKNLKIDAHHFSRIKGTARKVEHDFLTYAGNLSKKTLEETRDNVDRSKEIISTYGRLCADATVCTPGRLYCWIGSSLELQRIVSN